MGILDKDGAVGKERLGGARGRLAVMPEATTEVLGERASNMGVVLFSALMFTVPFLAVLAGFKIMLGRPDFVSLVVAFVAGTLVAMSVHIAQQWERIVVLRLGKFNRVSGPGLFWTIPFLESNAMRIDQRTRVTTFGAEETLTSDFVPLSVDAVVFWMMWDAQAACTEVRNVTYAVELAAQTALRDAIGRSSAVEVPMKREQLDRELKKILENKVSQWGVSVLSVEVRNIILPEALQEAMSLDAQAEQRKRARMTLIEAEQDICEAMVAIGELYGGGDAALRLRAMHLLYESMGASDSSLIVPSSFSEGFGDVLSDKAKESLFGNAANGKL